MVDEVEYDDFTGHFVGGVLARRRELLALPRELAPDGLKSGHAAALPGETTE